MKPAKPPPKPNPKPSIKRWTVGDPVSRDD